MLVTVISIAQGCGDLFSTHDHWPIAVLNILHLMHNITTSEHCYTPKHRQKYPKKYTNSPECSCCGGGALPDPVTTPPARNVRASTRAEAARTAVSTNIRGNILCRRWPATDAGSEDSDAAASRAPPMMLCLLLLLLGAHQRDSSVMVIISGSRNQQRRSPGARDLLKN